VFEEAPNWAVLYEERDSFPDRLQRRSRARPMPRVFLSLCGRQPVGTAQADLGTHRLYGLPEGPDILKRRFGCQRMAQTNNVSPPMAQRADAITHFTPDFFWRTGWHYTLGINAAIEYQAIPGNRLDLVPGHDPLNRMKDRQAHVYQIRDDGA